MPKRGRSATYEAPPNIALVKYWGVRNAELTLPTNSSLSVTLERLRSRTTVRFGPDISADRFVLNGAPTDGAPLKAVSRILDIVRDASGTTEFAEVDSTNNFPTASGLASSASGFAALAGAAMRAAGLRLSDRALSRLARRGSGSAARSVFGGIVEWNAGRRADGEDSFARSLFSPSHWRSLIDLVAVVENAPVKAVRSAEAMRWTVATSPEFPQRLRDLPRRLTAMRRAIRHRDAERLFPLIMEECDNFREVCETTTPSLDYLTSTSRQVLAEVRSLNREMGHSLAAYTHDAGAHVHVFTLQRHRSVVARRLGKITGIRRLLALRPGSGGRLVSAETKR